MQILWRIHPRGNRIAKEYEVRHYAGWINGYHVAHTTEGRVLFIVISYVTQRCAPVCGMKHYVRVHWFNKSEHATGRHSNWKQKIKEKYKKYLGN